MRCQAKWIVALPGLGPIGGSEEGQQGFLLHSVLAVRAPSPARPDATGHRSPVTILGLVDQQYLVRAPRPEGEPSDASKRRLHRERESRRRIDSGQRLGQAPADTCDWSDTAGKRYPCGCRCCSADPMAATVPG